MLRSICWVESTWGHFPPFSGEELLTGEPLSLPPLGGWWALLQPGRISPLKWYFTGSLPVCLPLLLRPEGPDLPEWISPVVPHCQPLGFSLSPSSFPNFSSLSQAKINLKPNPPDRGVSWCVCWQPGIGVLGDETKNIECGILMEL